MSEINEPFYFFSSWERLNATGSSSSERQVRIIVNPSQYVPEVSQRMQELQGAPGKKCRNNIKISFVVPLFGRPCSAMKMRRWPKLLLERIPGVYAMCDAVPVEEKRIPPPETIFRRPGGSELATGNPLVAAALKYICSQWPRSVSFEAILAAAQAAQIEPMIPDYLAGTLCVVSPWTCRSGFLHLNILPFKTAGQVSDRPVTSALVRRSCKGRLRNQSISCGDEFPGCGEPAIGNPFGWNEGSTNVSPYLIFFVSSGQGVLSENGTVIDDPAAMATILEKRVREGLNSLLREGMLVE